MRLMFKYRISSKIHRRQITLLLRGVTSFSFFNLNSKKEKARNKEDVVMEKGTTTKIRTTKEEEDTKPAWCAS